WQSDPKRDQEKEIRGGERAAHACRARRQKPGGGDRDKSSQRVQPTGHGRLRLHQRAPSGSAGASRSRPTTPSGTMVASVSCDGVVEWSNDTLAAQLNE